MQTSDEKHSRINESLSSKEPRLVNYYIAIAVDIILLYFFNNIIFANIVFLSEKEITDCLWAINLALGAGIIINFIFLIYRPRWFRHLMQAVLNALAILALYIIFRIFPFTFDKDIYRTVTRIVLLVMMAGIGIGFFIELVKFGITWMHRQPPSAPQLCTNPPQFPEPPSAPPTSPVPPEPPQST